MHLCGCNFNSITTKQKTRWGLSKILPAASNSNWRASANGLTDWRGLAASAARNTDLPTDSRWSTYKQCSRRLFEPICRKVLLTSIRCPNRIRPLARGLPFSHLIQLCLAAQRGLQNCTRGFGKMKSAKNNQNILWEALQTGAYKN